MYQPMACTAVSHTTIAWDVRPGGTPTPGKDQPGNWYHDHQQPYVDLGGKTPRLHWQIGFDESTQDILETRGLVTLATDAPGAALLEGQVTVKALCETPDAAGQLRHRHRPAGLAALDASRQAVHLDAPPAVRQGGPGRGHELLGHPRRFRRFQAAHANFNCWWFADEAELAGRSARFRGQFGVDTDLYVAVPSQVKLFRDTFVHDQCEPIVGSRHQAKFRQPFSEKQVLCRVEGRKDSGFLVVLFPYKPDGTASGHGKLAGRQRREESPGKTRPTSCCSTRLSTKSAPTASRPRRPAWWSKSPMRRTSRSASRQADKPLSVIRNWKVSVQRSWW